MYGPKQGRTASVERYNAVVAEARKDGFPIFEMMLETPWHRVSDAETTYREIFRDIPLGLSFLAFHFNAPGDFDVVEPKEARIRTEEYALFRTPQIAKWLQQYGLKAIGFREIRDDLRTRWANCSRTGARRH